MWLKIAYPYIKAEIHIHLKVSPCMLSLVLQLLLTHILSTSLSVIYTPWEKYHLLVVFSLLSDRRKYKYCGIQTKLSNISHTLWGFCRDSLVVQVAKSLPAMWETQGRSLGWEDSLEKEMATRASIFAWGFYGALCKWHHIWCHCHLIARNIEMYQVFHYWLQLLM